MKKTSIEISQKKFLEITRKYPPNKWIKFIYKYFSQETSIKDMKFKNFTVSFLMVLFLFGFVATLLRWPRKVIAIFTLIYSLVFVILAGSLYIAILMNRIRIKKISKELGCSIEKYNEFIKIWGNLI